MSQSEVRTFRAATMQEALAAVRREIGADAVILKTRELPAPRFFRWRAAAPQVEVTVGTGVNVRTPHALLAPLPQPGPAAPARIEAPPSRRQPASEARPLRPSAIDLPVPCARPTPAAPQPAETQQQASISRQLSSIQQMVSQLTRESWSREDDVPTELFQLYTELIDAEVDEELARDLVRQLKRECAPEELANAEAVKTRLRSTVEAEIRCTPPICATPGRRRVVALVGPTGVGKTTTIAKLAANFRLRDGIRMGLVTVDTYRIAAVEQLRTYAEIIDLPMKVVTSPGEMRRALDELNGLDLVLIDTAGRSPRDELKIQELKSLLAEAHVDEVHLVLSLVASARSLQATAEKFAPAGTTSLILTKLDEAVGMGSLLSVSRRVPLPVSYLTTGQDVPDDIEHAQARRISRLVLGDETLFTRRRDAA
ncbi:MAG: flagellar biosynthesis protein FlhF [Planctomycetaceae bacterium]